MNKAKFLGVVIGALSFSSFAGTMGSISPPPAPAGLWGVTGSIGYTHYENMYRGDGNTALGRFALERQLYAGNTLRWGLELGVQSGNSMRVAANQVDTDALGGLPIQSTVKPMLDLLVTLKTTPFLIDSIYAQVKGGAAYRRWQFENRDSINDLTQFAGEVQAGLGVPVSANFDLSLSYQGVYGGNPNLVVNALNQTAHVSTIPIQHGVLLGLTWVV